jgi:hypothetical protein
VRRSSVSNVVWMLSSFLLSYTIFVYENMIHHRGTEDTEGLFDFQKGKCFF